MTPNGLNVLVYADAIGSREFALIKQATESRYVNRVLCFATNAGIDKMGKVEVCSKPGDDMELIRFCRDNRVDLILVGPEAPLANGDADLFRNNGFHVFGPNKDAAALEWSKAVAYDFMRSEGIPTAPATKHSSAETALEALAARSQWPVVVKFSGLAGGKGVDVCPDLPSAQAAVGRHYTDKKPAMVLLQEYLPDNPELPRAEISVHVFIDKAWNYQIVPAFQDYKQAYDGDQGKMTGGMGCFGPFPGVELGSPMMDRIEQEIIVPTVEGLKKRHLTYQGVLYFGLKLCPDGPKVVEFNCRFGDPEMVAFAELLKSDPIPLYYAVAAGESIEGMGLQYYDGAVVVVVITNEAYPAKGEVHEFPRAIAEQPTTYQAATRREGKKILADGGRIACVTGRGDSFEGARALAYLQLRKSIPGLRVREDIAAGY